MKTRNPVPVACFDLVKLAGLFRGIALAIEVQARTHAEWKSYNESAVINAAYALVPWRTKPGTVEISQDWKKIDEATRRRTAHILDTFLRKLHIEGGGSAHHYIHSMQHIREQAAQSTRQLFADVGALNREIAGEAGQAVRNLAAIQLGATLTLATLSCGIGVGAIAVPMATNLTAAGIALGYNIAGTFIKEQGQLSGSGAVAIAIESGKTATGVGTDLGKHKAIEALHKQATADQDLIRSAQAKITQYQAEIARKTSSAKIAKLGRRVAEQQGSAASAEQRLAQNAGKMRGISAVTKGIPIIFFAHDLYNAFSDYSEATAGTR